MGTQAQDPIQPGEKEKASGNAIDDHILDGEGYEISVPQGERPMAQQNPPAGRPLPSDH